MTEFQNLCWLIKSFDYRGYVNALSQFENINYQDSEGYTLLHYCINFCNYQALLHTMRKKANIDLENKAKLTPLHLAIWKGFLPLASALLQSGANPNVIDEKERTPLFFAVRRNDVKAIRLLVDFGADVNLPTKGNSVLSLAAKYGFSEAVHELLEADAKSCVGNVPPMISVIKSGSLSCLNELLNKNPEDILSVYNEKLVLYYAIKQKTTLLPTLAKRFKDEIRKMKAEGKQCNVSFPPSGLTKSDIKRLNTALEKAESVITQTSESENQTISIWKKLPIYKKEDNKSEIYSEIDTASDTPFDIPEAPVICSTDEYIGSSDTNLWSISSVVDSATESSIRSSHEFF